MGIRASAHRPIGQKDSTLRRSTEVRTQINGLLLKMQEISQKGFNTESRAAFDKIDADVNALEADEKRYLLAEERESRSNEFVRSPRPGQMSNTSGGFHGQEGEQRDLVNKAFRTWARTGQFESRDLLTTSDATGGALIPQLFNDELINAVKFYGPTASLVKNKVTDNNGAPMKVVRADDTEHGLVLLSMEGTSVPPESDPAFQSVLVSTDTISGGMTKISFQEMEDSSFNLDTAIREYFGVRYGRGMEVAVTKGTDSAGTTLPNQFAGGLLAAAQVGATTATLAGGIGWTDLMAVFSALDPAFTVNAKWFMSATTRAYLISLRDGFGRPYFTPDPSGDNPMSKILGFDVVINQALPTYAAVNNTPILFGAPEKAYMLRTDGQPSVLRLNERFADSLEIG